MRIGAAIAGVAGLACASAAAGAAVVHLALAESAHASADRARSGGDGDGRSARRLGEATGPGEAPARPDGGPRRARADGAAAFPELTPPPPPPVRGAPAGTLTALDRQIDIAPPSFELRVETHPPAGYEIVREGRAIARGERAFEDEVTAGHIILRAEREGYRGARKELYLGADRRATLYLDPEDQLVSRALRADTAGPPKGLVFAADGDEIWVTRLLDEDAGVSVHDAYTGERLEDIDLRGAGAVELALAGDGDLIYASQKETGTVFEIDREEREIVRTFDTRGAWTKVLALDGERDLLAASNWVSDNVSLIDLESGELKERIRTVPTPRGLYFDESEGDLYVAGFDRGDLQRIDLDTGRREILFRGGQSLRHIVADEDARRMFISDLGRNLIWALDMDTEDIELFARTERNPNTIALDPTGGVLAVSCRGANNPRSYHLRGPEWGAVLLFDTEDGELLDAIVGGNQPTALDISADGTRLSFSNFLDHEIEVFDLPSYDALREGDGGRAETYRADMPKRSPGGARAAARR